MVEFVAKKKVKKPYISINKLAEYMQANPIRRRQILKALKEDSVFVKKRYEMSRAGITKSLINKDYKYIDEAIMKINDAIDTDSSVENWIKNDRENSILALKAFKGLDISEIIEFDVVNDIEKVDHVVLAGLKVSIRPDIYLRSSKSGKVGGVKYHFSKDPKHRLGEISLNYAATIIKYGFMEGGFDDKEIDINACISTDVFDKSYGTSPKSYKLIINSLGAACEEILARWDSI